MARRRHVIRLFAVTCVTAAAAVPSSGSASPTGTLSLNVSLALVSQLGGCQPVGNADNCGARTIGGPFPGLGHVSGSYGFLFDLGRPSCPNDAVGKALAYPIHLTVAGKGALDLAVAEADACVDTEAVRTQSQTFTVTGGTGIYAGASGSGTLERTLGDPTDTGRHGHETWKGTLVVPGLEFDTAPPTFSGAANKTVRAKRKARTARVVFSVVARDDHDGTLTAACTPKSGTRFRIGRTRVTCEAMDSSANAATATFTVTVRPRR